MNKELLEVIKQNINNDKLPKVAEMLISSYAYYHLWWALGWLTLFSFFCWQFIITNISVNKTDNMESADAFAVLFLLGVTIWFGFNFVKNVAVFLSPLGKLIQ